jgi:hypothetical protein
MDALTNRSDSRRRGRDPRPGDRRRGRRAGRALLAAGIALVTGGLVAVAGVPGGGVGNVAPAAAAAAAATGPSCVFTGPAIGALVLNVTPGDVINVDCKGMPANNPYLLIETSLLVAIDPAAAPLLQGQTTSVPGLLAVIAALPEMNALSVAFPTSDSSGVLNYNYTVPSTQPPDPNATCPPTTEEVDSGLIGCAVAMIDLTTFKPVTAGTFVLNYKGQPFFPPNPTLALSTTVAKYGQSVSVADAPGAKTFWWLGTLVSLYSNLGGGGGSTAPIPVTVKVGGRKTTTDAAVTPATYNGSVFTPPKLSGTFLVKGRGKAKVVVTLNASLLGVNVSNVASAPLRVHR